MGIIGWEFVGNGVAELQQSYHERHAGTSLGQFFLSLLNPNRVGLTQGYCNDLARFQGQLIKWA